MHTIEHIRTNILKINQEELAEAAGVTQATVSRWESDGRLPSIEQAMRICAKYPKVKLNNFAGEQPKRASS